MKNITLITTVISIFLLSCKKEQNNPNNTNNTTFSYVKTVIDSTATSNYQDSFEYEISTNLVERISHLDFLFSSPNADDIFLNSTSVIKQYSFNTDPSNLVYLLNLNASNLLSNSNYVYSGANQNAFLIYDTNKHLLYKNDSTAFFKRLDTLIWNGNNLATLKSKTIYNNGNIDYDTYNYTYNLTEQNNLQNMYYGKPYFGSDTKFTSENICTTATYNYQIYDAATMSTTTGSSNYSFNYLFDSKNRIQSLTIFEKGVFSGKYKYTYY